MVNCPFERNLTHIRQWMATRSWKCLFHGQLSSSLLNKIQILKVKNLFEFKFTFKFIWMTSRIYSNILTLCMLMRKPTLSWWSLILSNPYLVSILSVSWDIRSRKSELSSPLIRKKQMYYVQTCLNSKILIRWHSQCFPILPSAFSRFVVFSRILPNHIGTFAGENPLRQHQNPNWTVLLIRINANQRKFCFDLTLWSKTEQVKKGRPHDDGR